MASEIEKDRITEIEKRTEEKTRTQIIEKLKKVMIGKVKWDQLLEILEETYKHT